MTSLPISEGVVHTLPDDLRDALQNDSVMLTQWEAITPLARNEWICWIEDAKKVEVRAGRTHAHRKTWSPASAAPGVARRPTPGAHRQGLTQESAKLAR